MPFLSRYLTSLWILLPIALFLIALSAFQARVERIENLTARPDWSIKTTSLTDSHSDTYEPNQGRATLPFQQFHAVPWLLKIDASLDPEDGGAALVDYANFPAGFRPDSTPLYLAYQSAATRVAATLFDESATSTLPTTTRWLDPILGACLLIGISIFVALRVGKLPALVTAGMALALYPFGAAMWSGGPDPTALVPLLLLASLVPLIECLSRGARRVPISEFAAGIALASIFSLQPSIAAPVLLSLILGFLAKLALSPLRQPASYRAWSLGGGLTLLALPMLTSGQFSLEQPNAIWALGWIGTGEFLRAFSRKIDAQQGRTSFRWVLLGACVFLAAAGTWWGLQASDWMTRDLALDRLAASPREIVAANVAELWNNPASRFQAIVAWLPLLVAFCLLLIRLWNRNGLERMSHLAVAGTPLLALTALATAHPGYTAAAQAAAIAVIASWLAILRARFPTVTEQSETTRFALYLGIGACAFSALLGMRTQLPLKSESALNPSELRQLVNRDLAHWLAARYPDAVVWAPPATTQELIYFGDLRGIGTLDVDNSEGYLGALRIASAASFQEARVLLEQRQVTHLVLPAWDRHLDAAAATAIGAGQTPFIASLREWLVPSWLRPVAYYAPHLGSSPEQQLMLFEVVEEQSDTELLGAMATALTESGRLQHATSLRPFLARFPNDLSALIAKVQVAAALDDAPEFHDTLDTIDEALAGGADRFLPWTSRLNLSALLARGKRDEAAKAQLERVVRQTDLDRLRRLSSQSLFRLLALCRLYETELPTPELAAQAEAWLPPAASGN